MIARSNYEAKAQAAKAARQATQRKDTTTTAWFDPCADPRHLELLARKAQA